ncbi:MAG: chemotaxis protein CheW [Thiotrichaceae bacterium]
MAKKSTKKQALKAEPPLLKPSEALNRLQLQSIEEPVEKSATFEQIRYGFELGAIGVLTPLGMVCEIMDLQRIYLLPNAPAWLSGLINLRGNLVPVFDLGGLLGIKDEAETKDNISANFNMLVIGSDTKTVAVIIKGLPQPIPTKRHETELPPITDSAKKFVINAYSFQQRVWIDLDLETYLMSLHSQRAA